MCSASATVGVQKRVSGRRKNLRAGHLLYQYVLILWPFDQRNSSSKFGVLDGGHIHSQRGYDSAWQSERKASSFSRGGEGCALGSCWEDKIVQILERLKAGRGGGARSTGVGSFREYKHVEALLVLRDKR